MALIKDKSFKQWAKKYAESEEAFFKEYVCPFRVKWPWLTGSFSDAFAKLLELGVPTKQFAGEPWKMGSQ